MLGFKEESPKKKKSPAKMTKEEQHEFLNK